MQTMHGLFRINDSLTNKISFYHLVLLMASLPFNMFYSHLILISYTVHTLIHLNRSNIKPFFKLRTFALQSVFFITLFSTIYSINRDGAFNEWGKQITILIIPLLFCLNPLDLKKYRDQLFMAFSLVCTVTIACLYADAFITIKHYHLPALNIFTGAFTNHNFSLPIDIHATFFSMQVLLALVYMLSVLTTEKKLLNKVIYLMCSLILTAGLIQLSSKAIFIVSIIAVNAAFPWFLLKGRARLKFILGSAALFAVIAFGIWNMGAFRERYINELKLDMAAPTIGETSDSRLARWGVTMELIKKSPVIGYGAGSEIGLLQDGFFNKKLYDSYLNRLNTHSEYLSITLKSGLIGLLVYLGTLAFGFTISFRKKDLLFFTFMLLIAAVSFSENLLDVDKGIIFYAFFFTFFTFSSEIKKQVFVEGVMKASSQKPEEYSLELMK